MADVGPACCALSARASCSVCCVCVCVCVCLCACACACQKYARVNVRIYIYTCTRFLFYEKVANLLEFVLEPKHPLTTREKVASVFE